MSHQLSDSEEARTRLTYRRDNDSTCHTPPAPAPAPHHRHQDHLPPATAAYPHREYTLAYPAAPDRASSGR